MNFDPVYCPQGENAPLHYAALRDEPEIFIALFEQNNAALCHKNERLDTPLHVALAQKKTRCTEKILCIINDIFLKIRLGYFLPYWASRRIFSNAFLKENTKGKTVKDYAQGFPKILEAIEGIERHFESLNIMY